MIKMIAKNKLHKNINGLTDEQLQLVAGGEFDWDQIINDVMSKLVECPYCEELVPECELDRHVFKCMFTHKKG
ncbi:hypothetical protein [Butyrivibrio sp. VCB2006]|uniref:hypothetical protein n=1 Tax=Butyrivibrio sp. VCB2006 TaxID=1280679 RepID=UPI000424B700|nr:hypothetical protein [Butyrivibrio sp. VCB2006]